MSHAGKSKDLAEIASAISKGEMTIDQVMEEAPATYVMYGKGLDALAVAMMADRDPSIAPEVLWYYGGTGTGRPLRPSMRTRLEPSKCSMKTDQIRILGAV